MKILMISDINLFPLDAGNRQRMFRECEQIKKMGWSVDYLYWGENEETSQMRDYFGYTSFFQICRPIKSLYATLMTLCRKELDKRGISKKIALKYTANELYSKELSDYVRILIAEGNYDAIWMQYFFQSKILEDIDPDVLKIIDTHDRMTNRHKLFQKQGKSPDFYYMKYCEERKALSRADIVLAIQDKEKLFYTKMLNRSHTKVVTLGDFVEGKRISHNGGGCSYGMIASINGPNVEGIDWFISKVLPIVLSKKPDSRFYIAGNICNTLEDSDSYIKLGRVSELEDFYKNIDIAINSVQSGTGLNIKSIEALSYSTPLVSTSIGAKGLETASGCICVDDSAEGFADSIVCLLDDNEKRREMEIASEKFVKKYNDEIVEVYQSILGMKDKG